MIRISKRCNSLLKQNISIYIDADNISHKNCQSILDTITKKGKVVSSTIYGDWTKANIRPWVKKALQNDIQLVKSKLSPLELILLFSPDGKC